MSDVGVQRSPLKRALWLALGVTTFALGVIGAVLPVMPTTPFMLLAAACFARSSSRFYNMLLSHKVFGPVIYEWRQTRTIAPRVKAVAIAMIVVTFGVSIAFFVPVLFGKVAMAVVGVAVVVWLVRVPSATV